MFTTIARLTRQGPGGFRRLLTSKLFGAVSSGITWVLIPWYVYQETNSAIASAVASACNVVPFIAFGLVAGGATDRSSPLKVMVAMEVANAALMLACAFLGFAGSINAYIICAIGFLSSTAFVWFDVASTAIVPAIVGQNGIFEANSRLWMVSTIVKTTAAPVSFFLLNQFGVGWAFTIPAACYALSAYLISRIQYSFIASSGSSDLSWTKLVIEGIRFIFDHPLIRKYTFLSLGTGLSSGAVYGMMIIFGNQALMLEVNDYRIACIVAASSIGAVIGSMLAPKIKKFNAHVLATAHIAFSLMLMVAYSLCLSWWSAAAAVLVWNSVHTSFMIISISIRQINTPADFQGRVNATGRIVAWGSVPLGTLLCGILSEPFGIRIALLVMVLPIAASLLVALRGVFPYGKTTTKNVS